MRVLGLVYKHYVAGYGSMLRFGHDFWGQPKT
jgi:hypothetical protein